MTGEEKDHGFSDEELDSCLSEPKGIESGNVQVEMQCGSEERNEVAEVEETSAGDAEDSLGNKFRFNDFVWR